ncbi:hypothetical protein CN918_31535 [Priestia megaterium]|nr:hypothetical protein CN918_31535 [Priestia megaterium]
MKTDIMITDYVHMFAHYFSYILLGFIGLFIFIVLIGLITSGGSSYNSCPDDYHCYGCSQSFHTSEVTDWDMNTPYCPNCDESDDVIDIK